MELIERPRRLRKTPAVRGLVRETRVSKSALVYPIFVKEGRGIAEPIPSLDGSSATAPTCCMWSLKRSEAGVSAVLLFGCPR